MHKAIGIGISIDLRQRVLDPSAARNSGDIRKPKECYRCLPTKFQGNCAMQETVN